MASLRRGEISAKDTTRPVAPWVKLSSGQVDVAPVAARGRLFGGHGSQGCIPSSALILAHNPQRDAQTSASDLDSAKPTA